MAIWLHNPCPSPSRSRAFTLLEVMLAVMVLGMVSISIFRFVETTLMAVRVSKEQARDNALTVAVARYLREEIQSLPEAEVCPGVVMGDAHRFSNVSADELRWISRPGSGVLTRHAEDLDWTTALTTNRTKKGDYELGMRRQDAEGRKKGEWFPLLTGVRGFEVRYFDPRSKEWLENWTDAGVRPTLIRVRLWRDPVAEAYEMVVTLPKTGVPAAMETAGRRPGGMK